MIKSICMTFCSVLITIAAVVPNAIAAFQLDGSNPQQLPIRLRQEPNWATGARCGPNSLYMLLRLSGIDYDLEKLTAECNVDTVHGCSVKDLRDAAGKSGLPCEAYFVSPDDLSLMTFPLIAHIGAVGVSAPSHFLVVFEYRDEDKAFGIMDGTSGVVSYRTAEIFSRNFSGYVLVPNRGLYYHIAAYSGVVLGIVLISLAYLGQNAKAKASTATVGTAVPVAQ